MQKVSSEFSPSITNPYFFVRKGIYKGILRNASFLTGRILDFGCGSKPYKSFFTYSEYIGVDFENPGHPHDQEQIDLFYDGKTIPLEDKSVDSVLSSEVFEHVFNLPEILKELHRVMKKDAYIMVTCPFVWKEHEEPYDYARYTQFAIEDMMLKNGFKKVLMEKGGNFIEVIFQLVILFLYDTFFGKANRFWVTRNLFIFFFVLIPNLLGGLFSKVFKNRQKMYLNNIVIFQKC
ncbi:MAG: methyltransferase domain-containing protein [Flavobacterium sp.]